MYSLNKLIGCLTSPIFVGMAGLLLGILLAALRFRLARWLVVLSFLWLWFWMSPATYRWLASGLEKEYPVVRAEVQSPADAIVVLGGGMSSKTNATPYSEMSRSADRVWHGARLYRAGKAPKVFVTCEPDIQLLTDLGVPRAAIEGPSGARNTEEEARFIGEAMKNTCTRSRVLVVTSAWHMRRALLMFKRYAPDVEAVPAAADHEALVFCGWRTGFGWKDLIPDPEMFSMNCYIFHELVGYWGYRLFRK